MWRCRRRPWRHTFYFRSKTLKGVHQFHLNFTKESGIIIQVKFDKEVIRKMLTELWPFFILDFG